MLCWVCDCRGCLELVSLTLFSCVLTEQQEMPSEGDLETRLKALSALQLSILRKALSSTGDTQ